MTLERLSQRMSSSSSSSSAADGPDETLRSLASDDIDSLTAQQAAGRPSIDGLGGSKGCGPRLFAGHVPKEVTDEMVRQHFSKWGTVNDVYFPRHKKTLKRRPFCFITFANKEDAERALAESGLEIAGVPIKNLTMVEDRDKYYTNKHATARQALLQALKQLGPGAANGTAAPANGAALPPANGAAAVSSEQLSNLAAMMALEGVPTEVVLQTLGLPAVAPEPALPAGSAGLSGLDAALLAQALSSPALSSQAAYEQLARGSLDLRNSFDVRSSFDPRGSFDVRSSFDLASAAAVQSARASMDLSSLQQGLAAISAAQAQALAPPAAAPFDVSAPRMVATDSRSTLTSSADTWSNAPSARTSVDASSLLPVTAGFLASSGSLGGLQTRLSLDAALQLHQSQQLLASQARLAAGGPANGYGLPPQQQNLSSVMHSGFYQPAAPKPQPEVQHSMQTIMSSGLYGGPPAPQPTRHSMCEFGSGNHLRAGTAGLPFASPDAGWGMPPPAPTMQQMPAVQQLPQQHAPNGTLAGYSTVLRPSIDRGGLPPLPPRSPGQNQDPPLPRQGSPDAYTGLSNAGWPLAGARLSI